MTDKFDSLINDTFSSLIWEKDGEKEDSTSKLVDLVTKAEKEEKEDPKGAKILKSLTKNAAGKAKKFLQQTTTDTIDAAKETVKAAKDVKK